MEIKNIVNEEKVKYPKIKEISKKRLLNNIPEKWLKVGLSFLGVSMIMKSQVFAITVNGNMGMGISPEAVPIHRPIKIFEVVYNSVEILSLVIFIVTGFSILITNIKAKKNPEHKKAKKWMKIICIIFGILFTFCVVTKNIITAMGYYGEIFGI